MLGWLGKFESLKNVVPGIKLKWVKEEEIKEIKGSDKEGLIKGFCLKLGEMEEVPDCEKKRIFRVVQLSVKMLKSKANEEKQTQNEFLELLIRNKKIEIQRRMQLENVKKRARKSVKKVEIPRRSSSKLKNVKLDPVKKINEGNFPGFANFKRKMEIKKKEISCQTKNLKENEGEKKEKLVCFVCFKMFFKPKIETETETETVKK